jgi:hypothetical protein
MRRVFSRLGFYLQTPAGIVVAVAAVWHAVLWWQDIPINYVASVIVFSVDIVVAFILLDRLVYFFSQFVLPIQNKTDRKEIYKRVRIFERGERGPTLFVKNGRVITHAGEAGKRGVIALDTASAVVLRTDTKITGTAGPGIRFTAADEYVAGSVDLRAQWQFIGPLRSEQPFLNPVPTSPKNYNDLQSRRQQTAGWTRDGLEVSPSISIKFRVKSPPRNRQSESGVTSQYGYDPHSVRNAVMGEVIRLDASVNQKVRMEWNKLPEHLVVNIWREYVRKFKLEELFALKENSGDPPLSGLQFIEEMINKRVKQDHVEALDDAGGKTGEWLESLEYKQLKERGLEITAVRIHNLLFDLPLEEKRINEWSAEWMKIAKREEALLKEKETLIETAARNNAAKYLAGTASSRFVNPIAPPQEMYATLRELIEPLRDAVLTENRLGSGMDIELRKMDEILKWLLVNSADHAPEREERG